MQQQDTSWTRHQVVCFVLKEIVQLLLQENDVAYSYLTRVKSPTGSVSILILNTGVFPSL